MPSPFVTSCQQTVKAFQRVFEQGSRRDDNEQSEVVNQRSKSRLREWVSVKECSSHIVNQKGESEKQETIAQLEKNKRRMS